MHFQVPKEMKKAQKFRKEDAIFVMYEMIQQIVGILTRDFSSTDWSEIIIEDLLVEVHGQMNRLEPIQKENFTIGDTTVLNLKNYYFKLGQYLKSMEYNICAWIIVKAEMLRNFSVLKRLTGYLLD